jgi:integrase-like protein/endoribonuclease L-PSP
MRGIDPKTNTLVADPEARVRQAFRNMEHIAGSEGARLRDAVRLVVYVTDMYRFRPIVNKVQEELWGAGPYPPRTIIEVHFPEETAPKYLLRDRDAIYGNVFVRRVKGLGMSEILIAPRAPWQNPLAERVIGSIRRECLDHVIVLNERHLRRLLRSYLAYYNATRPHQALHSDSPHSREVQPPAGRIVATPLVGGLHHRYQRVA